MNLEHIILVYIIPMLAWLTIISVTLRLLVKKQSSSATLSWLMLIYLVPVIGVLAYLIFGEINSVANAPTLFVACIRNIAPG